MSNILAPQLSIAITNDEFLEVARKAAQGLLPGPPYDQSDYIATTGVNLRRLEKLAERIELDPDLVSAIRNMDGNMKWVLINEPWCSDGAFAQPVLHKIASASEGRIKFSVLLRDQHPEVMDQFLTNGGRAIPKLIALNNQNEVLWTWGPRPETIQNIVLDMIGKPDYNSNEKLKIVTRWYMKDKGKSMQNELLALVRHHKQ